MGQSPLFEAPPDRFGARLHDELFGALPAATGRQLDVPEVAAAVRPLLAAGWRPAQLAARVGALPAADDPVVAVVAFLEQLLERDCPQHVWERERADRERERAVPKQEDRPVASEASRAHWVAEARRSLGLPARTRAVGPVRPMPACASCGAHSEFFVTRQVRLCTGCVTLLGSGRARLTAVTQAG